MAMSWGEITRPVERNGHPIGAVGAVTLSRPSGLGGAPSHPLRYDATDSRHNYETGQRPWASVDMQSGPASHEDWACTGNFEDGPGAWRQT